MCSWDEATSNVDTRTELHIQEGMRALRRGRNQLRARASPIDDSASRPHPGPEAGADRPKKNPLRAPVRGRPVRPIARQPEHVGLAAKPSCCSCSSKAAALLLMQLAALTASSGVRSGSHVFPWHARCSSLASHTAGFNKLISSEQHEDQASHRR
jgi:hypothetical protein